MICVDTSVWVSAFRAGRGSRAEQLSGLLDSDQVALPAPVRLEILSGAPFGEQSRLRRVFSALPVWYPGEDTWARLDEWVTKAVGAGERFGVADLLIAAIAADHAAALWTLDLDFERMEALGMIRLHRVAQDNT